jgi:phosphate transport system substrate-binding protein
MLRARLSAAALFLALIAEPAHGEIVYVGSSTIGEHVIEAAATAFAATTGIRFSSIQTQGSGKGLEMVLQGEAQLAGVARSLTPAEKWRRFYYEIIGYDALTVFVHPDNPVKGLSRLELRDIFAGRITNWKQVGGRNAPIVCITQVWGGKRGQMVEFHERVMDGLPYRSDRREVDRQIDQLRSLASEPRGITVISPAFAEPGVKAALINGYAPEPNNIRSGAYVLSRPLVLVSVAHPPDEVKRFLQFMLSPEGQAIVARKFVPIR